MILSILYFTFNFQMCAEGLLLIHKDTYTTC